MAFDFKSIFDQALPYDRFLATYANADEKSDGRISPPRFISPTSRKHFLPGSAEKCRSFVSPVSGVAIASTHVRFFR